MGNEYFILAVRIPRDTRLLEQATEIAAQAVREMDGKASVNIREVHVLDAASALTEAKRRGMTLDLIIFTISQLTQDVRQMIVNIHGNDPLVPIFAITDGIENKYLKESLKVKAFGRIYLTTLSRELKKEIKASVDYARKRRVRLESEKSDVAKKLGSPSNDTQIGKRKLRL
ncbi:MAG: hypothetical protein AB1468_05520 [Candidatus Micrarchaeota archaeon]